MERKQYEILYIIPAKYTEAEVKSLMDKIKGIIEVGNAKVLEMHNLGKRRLAYPIGQVRFGNYVLAWFDAETTAIAKIDELLRLNIDITRHLITLRDKNIKTIPSFAEEEPKHRDEREERPRFAAPTQAPIIPSAPVNPEELDKKLDAILNEEVL